nr:MAG TPA: baseplate protein [Caudoviricetes sp.]
MVFEDRAAKYPGRWTMVKSDGTSEIVTLIRNDEPTKEGTPINASTLNELSTVAGAINAKEEAVSAASSANSASISAAKSAQSASADAKSAGSSAASAKAEADRAAAIVSTDKTLSVEGAPADAKAVGDALKNIKFPVATATTLGGVKVGSGLTVDADGRLSADSALAAYPVGSIFQTVGNTSPAALFGGTWQEIAQNRVLMGASYAHAAGTTVEAGLPNITGSLIETSNNGKTSPFRGNKNAILSIGAFAVTEVSSPYCGFAGYEGSAYDISFDASHSNPIYGRSSTVQPAAYYVHIWRRVA